MPIMLQVMALALAPVAMFALLWLLVLAPSRYRAAVTAPLRVPARAAARLFRRLTAGRRRPKATIAVVDPFVALSVQMALGRLEAELTQLAADESAFARGFRVAATQAAYDDVLAQACALAQIPLQRSRQDDRKVARLMEELALAERGWMW